MIWAMIPGPLKRALAWLVAGLGAVAAAWMAGRRSAALRAENKGLQANIKTRERMDNAESNLGDDPAVLREWLRDRPAGKR